MPTKHANLFAALAAPFRDDEVKTRAGGGGRQLSYITARVAMNRLDEVVGPENWRNRHRLESLADGYQAIVCTIEIKIDGEWIAKEDAGGFKEMTEKNRAGEMVEDEENTVKTAYSDALKRTAVLWGIGRYLYRDGSPHYGEIAAPPVATPSPRPSAAPRETVRRAPEPAPARREFDGNPPSTGKALFSWIRRQEEQYGKGLLQMVNDWGKGNRLPNRMVDWPDTAVAMAYEAALHMLPADGVTPDEQRHYEEALAN